VGRRAPSTLHRKRPLCGGGTHADVRTPFARPTAARARRAAPLLHIHSLLRPPLPSAPAAAHEGLARLQANGWVGPVVTQNVDRLHHRAGSPPGRVLELHGTTHRVVCMGCGEETCRHDMQAALAELNPEAAALLAATMAAGGGEPGRWRRALRAGTAADARATASAEGAATVPVRRPDGDVELVDAGEGRRRRGGRGRGALLR
jgi:hypothetical protein